MDGVEAKRRMDVARKLRACHVTRNFLMFFASHPSILRQWEIVCSAVGVTMAFSTMGTPPVFGDGSMVLWIAVLQI